MQNWVRKANLSMSVSLTKSDRVRVTRSAFLAGQGTCLTSALLSCAQ